ncbi:MAG TPA: YigZ family protein [Candidatus Wallbacteria bacterium]|nr:YigZ family protein [Candidatus Wallbacteria bacterium]
MLTSYNTIKNEASCEIVIQKSRFISDCFFVTDEKEAVSRLDGIRKKYNDATHHCYAYAVGTNTVFKRFNDDGEPSGTAGMPILNVITHQDLVNLIVIVTRYFGGIKLGSGGLVRAYSAACSEVLTRAGSVKMALSLKFSIKFDYTYLGSIERFLKQPEIAVLATDYQENVKITAVTEMNKPKFTAAVNDICNGRVEIEEIESVFHAW